MRRLSIALFVLFLLALAGCSNGNQSNPREAGVGSGSFDAMNSVASNSKGGESGFAYEDVDDKEMTQEPPMNDSSDVSVTDPNRKLIRTASLECETTEFDTSISQIESLCSSLGGFIESSNVTGGSLTDRYQQMRRASYTFRIPSTSYNTFISDVGGFCTITNKGQNTQDITENYYDTESRLRVLRMRQERLENLLLTEKDSMAIINYENSLSDTLYEIERLTGTLRKYDSLVEYSSISLQLHEVVKYTEQVPIEPEPDGAWNRIVKSFNDSVKAISNFIVEVGVFLLGNVLYFVSLAAIIFFILFVIRRNNKSRLSGKPGKNSVPPVEKSEDE